jgi:hypothetical protein
MGQVAVTRVGECDVFRVDRDIYLVKLAGTLSLATSTEVSAAIRRHHGQGSIAVVYQTTPAFEGYDAALRLNYVDHPSALTDLAYIGIVTDSRLLRMVAATVAIGLRLARGIRMTPHDTVENAIEGARDALAATRARDSHLRH